MCTLNLMICSKIRFAFAGWVWGGGPQYPDGEEQTESDGQWD